MLSRSTVAQMYQEVNQLSFILVTQKE